MKRQTVRYEGVEERVVMQSKVVSASEICRASRAEGVHSLQVPRQTHQTPFAPCASQSAQQELPEFHDVLDQSEDRLNRAFAQRIQLAPASRLQPMPRVADRLRPATVSAPRCFSCAAIARLMGTF